jgi:hypothetical protein
MGLASVSLFRHLEFCCGFYMFKKFVYPCPKRSCDSFGTNHITWSKKNCFPNYKGFSVKLELIIDSPKITFALLFIIIIITIICYHLYAGYWQLCTWSKPCFYSIQCCSYSVVTIYGTCTAISRVECSALLHQYFPKYVYSVQYGCFS